MLKKKKNPNNISKINDEKKIILWYDKAAVTALYTSLSANEGKQRPKRRPVLEISDLAPSLNLAKEKKNLQISYLL